MSLSIAGISSQAAVPFVTVPPATTAAPPSSSTKTASAGAQPTTADRAQQQRAINQLLTRYRTAIQQGAANPTAQALARQISTAARALGENVSLPKAPATESAAAVPAAATGRVNTLA